MSRPAFVFTRALRTATARRAAVVALGAGAVGAYTLDKERLAAASSAFSGLWNYAADAYTLKLDAAVAAQAQAPGKVLVDTATSVAHPLTLTPSSAPELALVGVGVRTVSFLSFKVYSAGFYANDYTLKRLRSVPGWDKFEPTQFAGPGGEELVQKLMDLPTAVAVRIVPVRNTDFGHLRDGFTRTLLARAKEQRKAGVLNGEEDDIKVDTGIQVLKSVFPAGSVPKGSPLTLVAHDGNLFVEYGGRVIGAVHDKWIADNMIKAYFSTQPISPALRDSAAQGFERYYNEQK